MECITWFVPILPGKLEAWKAFAKESSGPRRAEHARSRQRSGITREVVALVQTPQGDFASVFLEAEDIAKAFKMTATSEEPFDVWFREGIADVHGLTQEMLLGPPPAEVHFDYRADTMAPTTERRGEKSASSDTD